MWPGWGVAIGAVTLAAASTACSAGVWMCLVPTGNRRDLAGAVYASQLMKYLPVGGVLQVAGQLSLTATRGIPLPQVMVSWTVSAATLVVAGLTMSAALVAIDDIPGWLRVIALLGPLSLIVLDPRVLGRVLGALRRVSSRIPDNIELPASAANRAAIAWSVLNLLLYASAYTLLLHSYEPDAPLFAAGVAAIVSWVIGYLVHARSAGLGVREACSSGSCRSRHGSGAGSESHASHRHRSR